MRSSVRILRKSSWRRGDLYRFVYFPPDYQPFSLFDVKAKQRKCFNQKLDQQIKQSCSYVWVSLANVSSFSQKPKQHFCSFDTSDSESCLLRADCVTSLQVCRSGLLAKYFSLSCLSTKPLQEQTPKGARSIVETIYCTGAHTEQHS